MKLRNFWSIGGAPGVPPLDPPLTSYWMFRELSWHTYLCFWENLTNLYGGARFPPGDVPPPPHTHFPSKGNVFTGVCLSTSGQDPLKVNVCKGVLQPVGGTCSLLFFV